MTLATIVDPRSRTSTPWYRGPFCLQFAGTVGSADNLPWTIPHPLDEDSRAALVAAFGPNESDWIGKRVKCNDLRVRPIGVPFGKGTQVDESRYAMTVTGTLQILATVMAKADAN